MIDRENIEIPLEFQPPVRLEGRFVSASANKLPELGNTSLNLLTLDIPFGGAVQAKLAADGSFTFDKVAWRQRQLTLTLGNPNVSVKEIRYGGQLISDGAFSVVPGAVLEIVLDDQAAAITGSTLPKARVLVGRAPFTAGTIQAALHSTQADDNGTFRIGSLAPGEYRVVATDILSSDARTLMTMLNNGLRVELERGEQKAVELKPSGPGR